MSYMCGIGPGMRRLGFEPREPHLKCDGCGATRPVARQAAVAVPYAWFLDGKAAPGWSMRKDEVGDRYTRIDLCQKCKPGGRPSGEGGR